MFQYTLVPAAGEPRGIRASDSLRKLRPPGFTTPVTRPDEAFHLSYSQKKDTPGEKDRK
jgi:hypothetical protein